MKSYTPPDLIRRQIEDVLENNVASFRTSPLDAVIHLLATGRHYSWIGIYLAAAGTTELLGAGGDPHQVVSSSTTSRILIAMKVASREVGVLGVEVDKEYGFGTHDRVLLERVADLLARFLTGPGKYLVRRAHAKTSTAAAHSVASGRR